MAERTDYYAVLGVARDAALPAIKAAYRSLASAHHPDRNPSDEDATTRFQSLVAAYSVLGDPERRADYDAGRPVEALQVEAGAPWAEVFGRVLDQLFGVVDRVAVPGGDTRYRLELSLSDAILGCTRSLSLPRPGPCAPCGSRGFDLADLPTFCPRCASLGTLERRPALRSERVSCPDCEGRGYRVERPCGACDGAGQTITRARVEIEIPARSHEGRRLVVRGAGSPGRGGAPDGDCFVELEVEADLHLRPEGDDVLVERPVPLPQALAGGWLEVPALSGSARIRMPKGSRDGDVLRMKGHGVPRPDGSRGDQLVTLKVEMPHDLSDEEARELLDAMGDREDHFPQTAQFEAEMNDVEVAS